MCTRLDSRHASLWLALLASWLMVGEVGAQSRFANIGRPATPAEIKAWDIDVRGDLVGLPAGRGSVAQGQDTWEAKCASCHGTFGESNEVFTPIVGGTKPADIESGRVAALKTGETRTTLMKLSRISTLWDYIRRAMPWNAPKTLTVDEVYAVTAYILNLADLVPADFTLSNENMAAMQAKLPNRGDGTTKHGLWEVTGKPDVVGTPCMANCAVEGRVVSALPEYARSVHGNLQVQNRIIGAVRGADTSQPPIGGKPGEAADRIRVAAMSAWRAANRTSAASDGQTLFQKNACNACHAPDQKTVGPSLADIAGKYRGQANAETSLASKVKSGGSGVWGDTPMPPQASISDEELSGILRWLLAERK